MLPEFIKAIKTRYDVTVITPITDYIGVHYTLLPDKSKMKTQPKLLMDLVDKYHIDDCPRVKTPAAYPSSVPKDLAPFNVTMYLSLLGSLLYLLLSRPDVGFAVSHAATKSNSPTVDDWKAMIRVLQYLYQTRHKGLIIRKQPKGVPLTMYIMVDASYLLYPDSKAQTGYAFSLNHKGFFYSKSKKQYVVTTSTTHAEMRALFAAVCEYIFIAHICEELGRPLFEPVVVLEDNMPVVTLVNRDSTLPKACKHFIMLVNWAREYRQANRIIVKHWLAYLQTPDILTKEIFWS